MVAFRRVTRSTRYASTRKSLWAVRDACSTCSGSDVLRLGYVETLVLDEADHMFDMGFLPDIRKILAAIPERRQNLLFSATMPREIRRLADDLLTESPRGRAGRYSPGRHRRSRPVHGRGGA